MKSFFLTLFLVFIIQPLTAAEIKNLKVSQKGERGIAEFDLAGMAGEHEADIVVQITYGDVNYLADKLFLKGDYGKGIKVGTGKIIWWDILKTIPAGIDGDVTWNIESSGNKSSSRVAFSDPTTGMEFVTIKGDCFTMGNTFDKSQGEDDEATEHVVCVNDFALAKNVVTLGDFEKFVKEEGYLTDAQTRQLDKGCYSYIGWGMNPDAYWKSPGFYQKPPNYPAVCVSYNDARSFADWLSRKSGKTYRLPTEAEWEFAARQGGKLYLYPWGSGAPSANIGDEALTRELPEWKLDIWKDYDDGWPYAAPVGFFSPNDLGLTDMAGNVTQWVSDWYSETYYQHSPRDNPSGPEKGSKRVIRGSSWRSTPNQARATFRDRLSPDYGTNTVGFRLAAPVP